MSRANRRTFLEVSAAAAGTLALGASAGRAEETPKLRMGLIGAGGYGMADARAALKLGGTEIVAVCDVDSDHLNRAAADLEKSQGAKPRTYKHHRDLLASDPLDAVIIASPPHWHALHLIDSLQAEKDVYCEKPVSYDVREGQAMVAAVNASKRIVQVGFQRRQSEAMKQAAQRVKAGEIGDLIQVDAQIHYRAGLNDPTPQSPPASLDWPLWCGPAPLIAYSPQVGHQSWRLEKTTGHGHLVDWGIHLVDAVRTLLGLKMPTSVTASGGLYAYAGRITTPDTLSVHFEFDGLPVHWRHRLWGSSEYDPEVNNGIFFFGTKGTVFATDQRFVVVRGDKKQEHKVATDMGTLHMADFLDAVRERRPPVCLMEDAFRTTATVQLAMISYETNSTVRWDAETMQVIDNPDASALLKREYRDPYQHPYPTA